MATHIEAKIAEILFGYLGTFAALQPIKVAYPNLPFAPDGQPYIAARLLRNAPIQPRIAFGKEPIRQGILQATVYWPEGQGIFGATELAGKIRDQFPCGLKITQGGVSVTISGEPRIASDIQEPAWSAVPVSISWTVYP